MINVCFEESVLDPNVREALSCAANHAWYGVLSVQALSQVQAQLHLIREELQAAAPLWEAAVRMRLSALVIDVMRLSGHTTTLPPTLIGRVLAYVHTKFKQPLTVAELACRFGITPNYLGRLFCAHTGESFNTYLRALRCTYACNMLRYSHLPVKDIAAEAGFSSVEYFFAAFKQQLGMTPKTYRERME